MAVGQSEIGPIAAEYYGLLKPNRSAARPLFRMSGFNFNRAGRGEATYTLGAAMQFRAFLYCHETGESMLAGALAA